MSYTIEHNVPLGIIELTFVGRTTRKHLKESTSKCLALARQTGTPRFLVDARRVKLAVSIYDFFEICTKQFPAEDPDRLGRAAVLPPPSEQARRDLEFFEMASRNRGWFVRLFPEPQSALNWLTADAAPDQPAPIPGDAPRA